MLAYTRNRVNPEFYRVTQLRTDNVKAALYTIVPRSPFVAFCVCVCFLPIHSGHQVRWTYQPGSHRRKVTQDF